MAKSLYFCNCYTLLWRLIIVIIVAMSSFLRFLVVLGILGAVSACVAQREDRGYTRTSADFSKIIPGTSTNRDVVELLGSPTSYSTFGQETWYYISARRESVAFLEPELVDQQVMGIVFTKEGVVEKLQEFNLKDRKNIALSTDKTPTEGNKITLWQQLLGNLGRFNTEGGGLPGQRSGQSGGTGRY